jgi:hypothetical protein
LSGGSLFGLASALPLPPPPLCRPTREDWEGALPGGLYFEMIALSVKSTTRPELSWYLPT